MFKLITSLLIMLVANVGYSANLTGAQCKNSLEPISSLRTNAFLFNDMLSVHQNPLGVRLQDFRIDQEIQPGSRVHTYIRSVQTALISCPQNCEGIVSNRGTSNQSVFSCNSLSQMSVLDATNLAAQMSNDDSDEAVEETNDSDEQAQDPVQHFTDIDLDEIQEPTVIDTNDSRKDETGNTVDRTADNSTTQPNYVNEESRYMPGSRYLDISR